MSSRPHVSWVRHSLLSCSRKPSSSTLLPLPSQALIDAAKKEGSVTWYTVQIVNQIVTPIVDAFEKKYGIKVNYVRANSDEVTLRVMNEAAAGHVFCDVFDGSSTVPALKHRNLVLKWLPDAAKDFPTHEVDAQGYWIALYVMVLTDAYNTEQVTAAAAPKSWDDYLDPKWKGKIAWAAGNADFGGIRLCRPGQSRARRGQRPRAFLEKAGEAGEYGRGLRPPTGRFSTRWPSRANIRSAMQISNHRWFC